MKTLTTTMGILALLLAWALPTKPCCQTLARLVKPGPGHELLDLFAGSRPRPDLAAAPVVRSAWLETPLPTDEIPPALRPAAAVESGRSVEEIAARIWYAGALLLTADKLVRSMDSVLENTRLRGSGGQYLGIDASPRGVGLVVELGARF